MACLCTITYGIAIIHGFMVAVPEWWNLLKSTGLQGTRGCLDRAGSDGRERI